ncbi:MAG: HD domain-containing phosphohydrolase [Pseudomonadota bacterium]
MTKPIVFFIDDEPNILQAIVRITRREQYQVIAFDDPLKALAEMAAREVAVVVADQRMPGMTGTELLEQVRIQWPDTIRMILSGDSEISSVLSAINQGKIFHFITKPCGDDDLKSAINEALNQHFLIVENKRLTELTKRQNQELIALNKSLEKKVEQRTRKIKQKESQLKEALEGIISAVALTVETRDPYTAGHQTRVAELACAIAQEMRLSHDQTEGVRLAGVIHDLGKIYVPAEILNRPGKLTHIERELIHVHPQVGFDILKNISFPWPIAAIVYQHHERMNGTGYPMGLSGENILLEARIIAVADVVEAMSSHRPYRPAPGVDLALKEIADNSAILYDADVVKSCLKLFADNKITLKGWMG